MMTANLEASGYVKIATMGSKRTARALVSELQEAEIEYSQYVLHKEDKTFEVWIQREDVERALCYFAQAYCDDAEEAYEEYLENASRGEHV